MAPFDQPFFIILNLAVGGVNYFADSFVNQPHPKPWLNTSPRGNFYFFKKFQKLIFFKIFFFIAMADFWAARGQWMPTWNMAINDDSHLQVDYVRVWAL